MHKCITNPTLAMPEPLMSEANLERRYEFMKSKFLNGFNMFEEFAKSIGAKVQDFKEIRDKGAR